MRMMKASSQDFYCSVIMPCYLVYWTSFLIFEMGTTITYSMCYHNVLEVLLDTTIMKKYTKWKKKMSNPIQISILHIYYMFIVVMSQTIG